MIKPVFFANHRSFPSAMPFFHPSNILFNIFTIFTLITLVSAISYSPEPSSVNSNGFRFTPSPGTTFYTNTPVTLTWTLPLSNKPVYANAVFITIQSTENSIKEKIFTGISTTPSQSGKFVWLPRGGLPEGDDYLFLLSSANGRAYVVMSFSVRRGGMKTVTKTKIGLKTVTERMTVEVTATSKYGASSTPAPTSVSEPPAKGPSSGPLDERVKPGEGNDLEAGSSKSDLDTQSSLIPNTVPDLIASNNTTTPPITLPSDPSPPKKPAFGDAKIAGGVAVGILFGVVGLGLLLMWVTPILRKKLRHICQVAYYKKYHLTGSRV